jgi:hypothetical protein
MKPVKILCENFKGLNFEHNLKLVNMFTGPNESGKTARLRAAVVALLGHDPEIGKQPSATIGFASDRRMDMTVHMEFDNALFITRTFKRNSKGEVNRSNSGEIPEVPAVIFDAGDYLEATAQERIKTVFNRIDISQIAIKDEDLIAKLSKLEAIPAAESVKAVNEMIDLVRKSISRRTALKATIQAWLEELVKTLQDSAKQQKSLQDNASSQMQTLRPPGKSPVSVADKIKEVQEKIDALNKQAAEFDAQEKQYKSTSSRREFIKKQLEKPLPDTKDLTKRIKDLEKEIAESSSEVPSLKANLEVLKKEATSLDQDKTILAKELETKTAALKDLEGKPKCPYCGSSKQGWKDEHRATLESQIKETNEMLTKRTDRLKLVVEEGRKVKADLAAAETAESRQQQRKKDLADLKSQLDRASKESTERAALEGELKGIEQIKTPDFSAKGEVAGQLIVLHNDMRGLQDTEKAYQQYVQNGTAMETAEKKLIEHQVRVEIYKQAAALVIAEQKAIVGKAFDSILDPARRFTDGIIGGRLDYQNDELGISTENGWVGHKFMSGRGQDLAYLGLQVALAQQSPIKVIVLDEFGDFDACTKLAVAKRLLELTSEGFIDSAFCADPDASVYRTIKDENFLLVELQAA